MTDIVKRLRDHLRVIDAYPVQTRSSDMAGLVQSVRIAADEIEKLRNQWPQAEVALRDAEIHRLRDEIAKLRAQVVSLQTSLDAGPPRPGKKTPNALPLKENP